MKAAINEWSDANFYPLTKGPRNITKDKKNLHSFHWPNALVNTNKRSAGLRKRTNKLKRADCPVMVEVRYNEDGSWTITRLCLSTRDMRVRGAVLSIS